MLGASRSLISLSTTQLVLGVILTLAALPYGLFAVAVSYVGRAYLTLPLQIWLLRRASGIRPVDSLRAVGAPLIASSVMGVALAIAMRLLDTHLAGWQSLLLLTAIGALFYAIALLAISGAWRGRFLFLFKRFRRARYDQEDRRPARRRTRPAFHAHARCCDPPGPLALVDFPDHSNVGDSAIWLGEMAYLRKSGRLPAYYSAIADFDDAARAARRLATGRS